MNGAESRIALERREKTRRKKEGLGDRMQGSKKRSGKIERIGKG